MQINGLQAVNSVISPARTANTKPAEPVQSVQSAAGSADQLDLSTEAQEILSTQSVASSGEADIRMDRVSEIRQAIADGTYETPEKISAALDRILDSYA